MPPKWYDTRSITRSMAAGIRSTESPSGSSMRTVAWMGLKHGYVDRVVRRAELKSEIAGVIDYCGKR